MRQATLQFQKPDHVCRLVSKYAQTLLPGDQVSIVDPLHKLQYELIVFPLLLAAAIPILWHDPGEVSDVDFARPARGVEAPKAPFRFLREDLAGNSPKVMIEDAAKRQWQVKGGPEARAEAFFLDTVGIRPRLLRRFRHVPSPAA